MKSAGELAAISIGGDDRDNIFWSRASGFGCGRQVRASDPGPAPVHLNLIPDGRDLGPESASHFCTFAQAVGRFALLHLGQHVVPLPATRHPGLPPATRNLPRTFALRTARGAVPTPTANHPVSGFPWRLYRGRGATASRPFARQSLLSRISHLAAWHPSAHGRHAVAPLPETARAARGAAPTSIQADAMSSHPTQTKRAPAGALFTSPCHRVPLPT